MKASRAIGTAAALAMMSGGAWVGCSSSSPSTEGQDASASSSSSSGSGTTSSSSSGGSTSSSSSSGAASSSSSSSSSGAPADAGGDHAVADAGGDGGTAEAGGDGATADAGGDGAVTWTNVWNDVVSPKCADCHGRLPAADGGLRGGIRVGMLDMSSIDAGYANLIRMPAKGTMVPAVDWVDAAVCDTLEAGTAGSVRVVPGDAGASLLFLKVHGFDVRPPCGAPMPEPNPGPGEIDSGPISQQAAAAEIMSWINQGANP